MRWRSSPPPSRQKSCPGCNRPRRTGHTRARSTRPKTWTERQGCRRCTSVRLGLVRKNKAPGMEKDKQSRAKGNKEVGEREMRCVNEDEKNRNERTHQTRTHTHHHDVSRSAFGAEKIKTLFLKIPFATRLPGSVFPATRT